MRHPNGVAALDRGAGKACVLSVPFDEHPHGGGVSGGGRGGDGLLPGARAPVYLKGEVVEE